MLGTTTTVWAVMRTADTTARALFTSPDDANAFAQALNVEVKAEAGRFKVYPWSIPAALFSVEDDTPEDVVDAINASLLARYERECGRDGRG